MTIGHQFVPAPPETHSPPRAIPTQIDHPSKSNVSPTYEIFAHNLFVSPAYAKTGGWSPRGKCRRAPRLRSGQAGILFARHSPLVTRHWLAKFFQYVSYANPRGRVPAPTGRLLRASKGNRMGLSARAWRLLPGRAAGRVEV